MYTDFYNLRARPFQLTPDYRFFFDGRPHRRAISYLTYGLSQSEGFIVITGEIGAGKTTLIDYLLSSLPGKSLVAAKVVTTQLEADDLVRMIVSAFGLEHEGVEKATILKRFEAFLVDAYRANKRVLLFVDEVQNLPLRAVEELRMLSNIQYNGQPLLQIYLVGQPEFRRTMSSPKLEQLRQRVITSYHLEPLDESETRRYIEHRLRQVGWDNDPRFTDEAFQMIYKATGGVPRRINLFCDRVLLLGYIEEAHIVDRALVEDVLADMENEGLSPTMINAADLPIAEPIQSESATPRPVIEAPAPGVARPVSDEASRDSLSLAAADLEKALGGVKTIEKLTESINAVESLVQAQEERLKKLARSLSSHRGARRRQK